MRTARVLIDASNLRVGGGVQAAASFLDEFARASADDSLCSRFPWLRTAHVEVSPLVERNLTVERRLWTSRTIDRTWRDARPRRPRDLRYDVEFNLFGPIYGMRRGRVRITGFADGTSLYPRGFEGADLRSPTWRQRLRKRYSKTYFTHGADQVIVEAEHVREALVDLWGLDEERVHVVPNAVNGVFFEPESWRPVRLSDSEDKKRVCYITRGYPHKNIGLLGGIGPLLRQEHGLNVEFVVTLTEDEWSSLPPEVRECSVNIGPIDVAQAPSVYAQSDAAVFPSLLELFSASPLEALVIGCPLAASDRPFVREFVGDAAEYFDPRSPEDAAHALSRVLTSTNHRDLLVKRGAYRARQFQRPEERALAYVELIHRCLDRLGG